MFSVYVNSCVDNSEWHDGKTGHRARAVSEAVELVLSLQKRNIGVDQRERERERELCLLFYAFSFYASGCPNFLNVFQYRGNRVIFLRVFVCLFRHPVGWLLVFSGKDTFVFFLYLQRAVLTFYAVVLFIKIECNVIVLHL